MLCVHVSSYVFQERYNTSCTCYYTKCIPVHTVYGRYHVKQKHGMLLPTPNTSRTALYTSITICAPYYTRNCNVSTSTHILHVTYILIRLHYCCKYTHKKKSITRLTYSLQKIQCKVPGSLFFAFLMTCTQRNAHTT